MVLTLTDIGLLLLRFFAASLLFFGHGLPAIDHFAEKASTYPDPFGMGPSMCYGWVLFIELACTLFVGIGFMTRSAVVPVLFVLAVEFFIQHAGDPWYGRGLLVIDAIPFLILLFAGPGQIAADELMDRGRVKRMMSMERR